MRAALAIGLVLLSASATAEQYGRALRILAEDPKIDSIIVIFIPPLVTKAEDVAISLIAASKDVSKTMLACFLGVRGVHTWLRDGDSVIPSYVFPESAARALGKVGVSCIMRPSSGYRWLSTWPTASAASASPPAKTRVAAPRARSAGWSGAKSPRR